MRSLSAKLRVAGIADRQWGLVTATQLAALGIDTAVVSRWLRDGYLYRIHSRVYAVAHRAGSVERDLAAALLYAGPGAMLSHATGVWWLG
jgi:Transcriptional regulator, AbiEi antitoxin